MERAILHSDLNCFYASVEMMLNPMLRGKAVPELFRYHEATKYFVMSIVREAYNKGLHLKDVEYCCPPAVLVYACIESDL